MFKGILLLFLPWFLVPRGCSELRTSGGTRLSGGFSHSRELWAVCVMSYLVKVLNACGQLWSVRVLQRCKDLGKLCIP